MKTHWTERSIKDYLFRIVADFIAQLEDKMEMQNISQDELAKKLEVTKGSVSQVLNHSGNITIATIIKYARILGMKVSIIAYEDDDPENKKGPINSEVFKICWEKLGKPRDFWAFQETSKRMEMVAETTGDIFRLPHGYFVKYPNRGTIYIPQILETAVSVPSNIQNQNKLAVNWQ